MKRIFKISSSMLTIIFLMMSGAMAQPMIYNEAIEATNIDVRGAPVTVGQITITTAQFGKAIVKFNGHCYASVGDRIILAASDSPNWSPNDGNVGVEVIDNDLNHVSFSHTRVYSIGAGTHDFYAVAENYVELGGTGITSIYGDLSVEFIPSNTGEEFVEFDGIMQYNVNLRGSPVVLSQLDVSIPSDGKVIVTFDGHCYATAGDRIILAASNTPSWTANDGNTNIEVYDSDDLNHLPFSHTREYTVTAGDHSFYAVGQNYVEMDGTGYGSVYGSLTVQFIPDNSTAKMIVDHQGISAGNVNFRGAPVNLADLTINVPEDGIVEVSFDGSCYTSPGDRIVLAASDGPYWQANNGNVSVEAFDNDLNHYPFSHTMVYEVGAGTHTFYAVGQNYVEMDGTGYGSVYGSLTVIYTPRTYVGMYDPVKETGNIVLYPNPSKELITVTLCGMKENTVSVEILDMTGKVLRSKENVPVTGKDFQMDISSLSKGSYLVRVKGNDKVEVLPFVKQ